MLKLKKRAREISFKSSSLSGQISSKKLNKSVQFESSLEKDYIYLLEFDKSVGRYLEQPLIIHYKDTIDLSNPEKKHICCIERE